MILTNFSTSSFSLSDALFYHSLGAFKQEVPSPTQDKGLTLKQPCTGSNVGSGQVLMGKRTASGMLAGGDVSNTNVPSPDGMQTQNNNMNAGSPNATSGNGGVDLINSLQNHHHQQMCHAHIPQQAINNATNNSGGGNGNAANSVPGNVPGNNNISNDNVASFQQMLEANNYSDKLNGNAGGRIMTPPQIDRPLISSAYSIDDTRFQYVLAAATSIATKNNEDTLTYLNQGQSYEIKLKKLGDLTNYRNKILKVSIVEMTKMSRCGYMPYGL